MPFLTGGNVIQPGGGQVIPGSRPRVAYVTAVPTDQLVSGEIDTGTHSAYRTPANGELAMNIADAGKIYERQAGSWVRIDVG
jgi:hypothetical protein